MGGSRAGACPRSSVAPLPVTASRTGPESVRDLPWTWHPQARAVLLHGKGGALGTLAGWSVAWPGLSPGVSLSLSSSLGQRPPLRLPGCVPCHTMVSLPADPGL